MVYVTLLWSDIPHVSSVHKVQRASLTRFHQRSCAASQLTHDEATGTVVTCTLEKWVNRRFGVMSLALTFLPGFGASGLPFIWNEEFRGTIVDSFLQLWGTEEEKWRRADECLTLWLSNIKKLQSFILKTKAFIQAA